jgi:transposase
MALSDDMRWLILSKHYLEGLSRRTIAKQLRCHRRTVSRLVARFEETGDIRSRQGQRFRPGAASANTIMTPEMDMKLLEIVTVMDDKSLLLEIFEQFCKDAGVAPHISTICRAMKRLGFTRKKVRAVARGTHSHVRRRRHTTLIVFAVTAVVPFVLLAASSRGSRS